MAGQPHDNSEVLVGPAFLEPRKDFKAYARNSVECDLYEELRGMKLVSFDYEVNEGTLEEGLFQLFDFSVNGCGFISERGFQPCGGGIYVPQLRRKNPKAVCGGAEYV